MRILLKNANIVNVFLDLVIQQDILIEDKYIAGVGNYSDAETVDTCDVVEDLAGKVVCPGLIDSHIHIESTMLTPSQFARVAILHGTTAIITDPHEITNVCGLAGIDYMLEASHGVPLQVFHMMPSCVPASPFDEAGATLTAEDIRPYYEKKRVLGLAEMMNYPGVTNRDPEVMAKLHDVKAGRMIANGHAPGLRGRALDKYISAGILDDHECSKLDEALEKLSKGQWIMVRQGSAARNLEALKPILAEPYNRRCLLATDDLMPADLLEQGHLDRTIRDATRLGAPTLTLIRMASIQTALYYGLRRMGAVAPGYRADLLILNDLPTMDIRDVYIGGKKWVDHGELQYFPTPEISPDLQEKVTASFHCDPITPEIFHLPHTGKHTCRVINTIPKELVTGNMQACIDFDKNNGIDIENDLIKIAVIERHKHTGHVGLGFVHGFQLKHGALASSVAHDSHNIVVVGADTESMATAAERVRQLGGGCVVADEQNVLAELPLPIAGLMSPDSVEVVAARDNSLHEAAHYLGATKAIDPFMNMMFLSLPVIPSLKMTTNGLVDVDSWSYVDLIVE